MTTINQKKNYIHPLTRVVLLNTEDTILAASGERADNAGILCVYPQRDNGQTNLSNTPWTDTSASSSPW